MHLFFALIRFLSVVCIILYIYKYKLLKEFTKCVRSTPAFPHIFKISNKIYTFLTFCALIKNVWEFMRNFSQGILLTVHVYLIRCICIYLSVFIYSVSVRQLREPSDPSWNNGFNTFYEETVKKIQWYNVLIN